MALKLILIFSSFVLGYLALLFIRKYDIYEKEPFGKMVLVMIPGGVLSILLSLSLYSLVETFGFHNFNSSIGVMLFVGPIEEFSKLAALFSVYFIFKKDMNEPTDGLIYMTSVVLGFSLIENLFYAMPDPASSYLLIVRLLISTPGHIMFSIFMGLGFYYYKKGILRFRFLVLTFVYACITHGIYDLIIFNGWSLIFFIMLLQLSYRALMWNLEYTSARSPFRVSLKEFIDTYKKPEMSDGIICAACHSKGEKLTYQFEKSKIYKCDGCEYYITSKDSIFAVFHFFGGLFGRLSKWYIKPEKNKTPYGTLFSANKVFEKEKLCLFKLDELNEYIKMLRASKIANFESRWWFKNNLIRPQEQKDKPAPQAEG